MTPTRLRKVASDLLLRWGRTLLTLMGLSLGLYGVGAVLVAFAILSNDLQVNFTNTNPPNIIVDASNADNRSVERLAAVPDVKLVERRGLIGGRIETEPGSWMSLALFVVEDFDDLKVATFAPEGGTWPPPKDGFLIERDGRFWVSAKLGSMLRLRLPGGSVVPATLSGFAYDPGQAPSRMDRVIYGYVSRATYEAWAGPGPDSRLLLTTAAGANVRAVAASVEQALKASGANVRRVEAYQELEHPHQFQFNAIIAMLAALAIVSFVMCAVLIVNLIDAVMANEQRSIGMMRAIGGRSGQISRDYLLGMGILGLVASAASLPFALRTGRGVASFVARAVNFDLLSSGGPVWLVPAVLAMGLLIPIAVASLRVARTTHMPVRDALARVDPGQGSRFAEGFGRTFSPLPLIQRMAVRNVARRPRRTLLTAITLALGLSFFMMSLNVRSSMLETVESVKRTKPHDIDLTFRGSYPVDELRQWIGGFENVRAAEYWAAAEGTLFQREKAASNPMKIVGVPRDSIAFRPDVIAGGWLDPSRSAGIVVTQKVLADEPDIRVGGRYRLRIGDRSADVEVIGEVKEFGSGLIYAPLELVQRLGVPRGRSNLMTITLDDHEFFSQAAAVAALEESLVGRDWQIAGTLTTRMWEMVIVAHLNDIARLLQIIAAMALFIGAMGLASSVSVGVVERYREIGVLKAIGGRASAIINLFASEAVFVALIGLGLAMAISPLLSRYVAATFGSLIIEYPFDYRAAPNVDVIAMGVGLSIALAACILPIRVALKMTIFRSLRSE